VLGIGIEQRGVAAGAVIDAGRLGGVVGTGERPLGPAQAADVELLFRELFAPGFQGFLKLVHGGSSSWKKADPYLSPRSTRTYDSTPVCHPRYTLPRLAGSAFFAAFSFFGITHMQVSKSNKLANVCYDIRGPVLKH